MSAKDTIGIMFPVGRLVEGSLYEPNTTDMDGKPLVVKSGPNAGQPRQEFYLGIAIAKSSPAEKWWETPWGAEINALANRVWPNGQPQRPDFAWKILDGDSTIPNKRNVRPCDKAGHPGHWIIKASGGFAPKIVTADGSAPILEPNAVMPGDFVQLYAEVESNKSTQTAGLYINHRVVAFAGYDAVNGRISVGPDPKTLGFGQGPKPANASAVPPGGMTPAAAGAHLPPPAASSPPTASAPPPAAAPATPTPSAPVSTPPPNTQFTANAAGAPPVPGVSAAPPPPAAGAAPPPPAAGPTYVMTGTGGAWTREQMLASGWTDEQLLSAGHMRIA